MTTHKFLVTGLLMAALGLAACDSGQPTATPIPPPTPTAAAAAHRALEDNPLGLLRAATQSGDFQTPLDATPDFAGDNIFFTAMATAGQAKGVKDPGAGVFKVVSTGGAASAVHIGAPFVTPRTLAMSPDGQQIVVADPGATDSTGKAGQLFVMPTAGGPPVPVRGSAGTAPQNVTGYAVGGQPTSPNLIYFTGKDPASGDPAVMTLPIEGADAPIVVAKGPPLTNPDGIVVAADGAIYVTNRSTGSNSDGSVIKIARSSVGTTMTAITEHIRTGDPAGVALSPDGSVLLVSAVKADADSAQVLLVDLTTLKTGTASQGISQNSGAGGIHASPGKPHVYAWAGYNRGSGGNGGTVYYIEVK